MIPDDESRQEFNQILQDYLSRFQPLNLPERACVDRMVAAKWRLRCLRATEYRMLTEACESQPPADAFTRTLDAFISLLTVRGFAVLSRYEATEVLNFSRALRNLLDLRKSGALRANSSSTPSKPPSPTRPQLRVNATSQIKFAQMKPL